MAATPLILIAAGVAIFVGALLGINYPLGGQSANQIRTPTTIAPANPSPTPTVSPTPTTSPTPRTTTAPATTNQPSNVNENSEPVRGFW